MSFQVSSRSRLEILEGSINILSQFSSFKDQGNQDIILESTKYKYNILPSVHWIPNFPVQNNFGFQVLFLRRISTNLFSKLHQNLSCK